MGLTSSHWGVYEFVVKNGRLTALNPFSHDRDPSPIGPSIIDLLDLDTWFLAHKHNYNVSISDPQSRVLQLQGPKSLAEFSHKWWCRSLHGIF